MSDAVDKVLDAIDELVDEQLSGYHNRSGYDHNVNQTVCGHCGEDWHGLPIKRHMREMRRMRMIWGDRIAESALEAYKYEEDDSQIICPGSDFIGPVQSSAAFRLRVSTPTPRIADWQSQTQRNHWRFEISSEPGPGMISPDRARMLMEAPRLLDLQRRWGERLTTRPYRCLCAQEWPSDGWHTHVCMGTPGHVDDHQCYCQVLEDGIWEEA